MATADKGDENIQPRKLRVLVADDNRDQADSWAGLLITWGYDVRVVYDGLAALETAKTYQPDVAVIDLGLPGMDGYQVALNLRRQPALKNMRLIAVTGHLWQDAPVRSKEYGFDEHLVKPVDLDRLQKLLKAAGEQVVGERSVQ